MKSLSVDNDVHKEIMRIKNKDDMHNVSEVLRKALNIKKKR